MPQLLTINRVLLHWTMVTLQCLKQVTITAVQHITGQQLEYSHWFTY